MKRSFQQKKTITTRRVGSVPDLTKNRITS